MTLRRILALVVCIVGFAATFLLWRLAPDASAHAWLAALATWTSAPLGCLGLILIHALTGGRWGHALRAQLRTGAAAILLLPLFFLPLVWAGPALYPWLRPGADKLANAFYLNETGVVARILCYFLIWFGLEGLVAWSFRSQDPDTTLKAVAPAGLMLLALSSTFMSIDMLMSLNPHFASSVFGLLRIADMGLLALSICVFAALWAPLDGMESLRQSGRLLLSLAILWAYLAFVELLIVWQSNLPNEASWYGPRLQGLWGALAAVVAVMRFFFPFFLLLSRRAQMSVAVMRLVSALLIIGAGVYNLWLVGPESDASFIMLAATFATVLIAMSAATIAAAPARTKSLPAG